MLTTSGSSSVFFTKMSHQSSSKMIQANQLIVFGHPLKQVTSITFMVKIVQCKVLFIRNLIDIKVLVILEYPALSVRSIKLRKIDRRWFFRMKSCIQVCRGMKWKLVLWCEMGLCKKKGENGILNRSGVFVVEGLWICHGGRRWNTRNRTFPQLLSLTSSVASRRAEKEYCETWRYASGSQ